MFYNYSKLEEYGKTIDNSRLYSTITYIPILFLQVSNRIFMCKTLSRAVVESTVRIPVRFQGLSPRSQTVCCIPYSTITPVLRCVLSVVRAVYCAHIHVDHISRRDCRFRTIVYLSLPENHNQNNCDSFIASIRYHFWLTELPPKFDNLDYIKSRS